MSYVMKLIPTALLTYSLSILLLSPVSAQAQNSVTINGVTAVAGGSVATFTLSLPEDIQKKTQKEKRPHRDIKIGLVLPRSFDTSQPQKYLFVWKPVNSVSDLEIGNISEIQSFAKEALEAGWAVFAINTDLGYPDGEQYPEMVRFGLDTLEAAVPIFKDSRFACAGFSGGAKNCTTATGALVERNYKLLGIFMGGCNQSLLEEAQKLFKANKSDYRSVKAFLSNGTSDNGASPAKAEEVMKELKKSGLKQTRLETFDGGHQLNRQHFSTALAWFEE